MTGSPYGSIWSLMYDTRMPDNRDSSRPAYIPGDAELTLLAATREELRRKREADEDQIESVVALREIYADHEIHREVRRGVPHFVARARTSDAHPWIAIKSTVEALIRAMESC